MSYLKKLLRVGLFAACLSPWYYLTSQNLSSKSVDEKYSLPAEIKVIETTIKNQKTTKERRTLERIIKTSDINFSDNFVIQTKRYTLIKDEDWLPSRAIGFALSIPLKVLLWDWNIGLGLDAEKSKATLAMLENSPQLKDLTVRINHNEVLYDCYRLFTDKKVIDRNNFAARVFLGVTTSFFGELFAEIRRGDYYNPMTQTVVLYSNIESFTAHELGHHQDYQRFTSDWPYGLTGIFPSMWLYKEMQASLNVRDDILSEEDRGQFNRYLLPAFGTYLLAAWYASKRIVQRKKLESEGREVNLDELKEHQKPEVHFLETLAKLTQLNADLYAGIAGYHFTKEAGAPELVAYASFAASFLFAHKTFEKAGTLIKKHFTSLDI